MVERTSHANFRKGLTDYNDGENVTHQLGNDDYSDGANIPSPYAIETRELNGKIAQGNESLETDEEYDEESIRNYRLDEGIDYE